LLPWLPLLISFYPNGGDGVWMVEMEDERVGKWATLIAWEGLERLGRVGFLLLGNCFEKER
ncbi:hypothetical protein PJP10_32745, partial [Mycobacterium kansasii]